MASVFTPCNGGVHKVELDCNDGGAVFQITIDGATIGLPVTGFAIELQGNYQFLHTVNDFIYLYVFGDRVGELVLTGMGFFGGCEGEEGGICEIFDFYGYNRVARRKTPIPISIGQCGTLLAFLTGMRVEASKPETAVAQWVLRFNVLIDRAQGGQTLPATGGGGGGAGVA